MKPNIYIYNYNNIRQKLLQANANIQYGLKNVQKMLVCVQLMVFVDSE